LPLLCDKKDQILGKLSKKLEKITENHNKFFGQPSAFLLQKKAGNYWNQKNVASLKN